MPYETVNEKVVQPRRIRVCARCRCEISDDVANKQRMQQVGSIGGSLGASLGGSILLGSVLGPVGMIGGAIAGSIAGSRAGAQAGGKVGEIVENQKGDLCETCRAASNNNQDTNTDRGPLGMGLLPRAKSLFQKPDNTPKRDQDDSSSIWGKGERLGSG